MSVYRYIYFYTHGYNINTVLFLYRIFRVLNFYAFTEQCSRILVTVQGDEIGQILLYVAVDYLLHDAVDDRVVGQ